MYEDGNASGSSSTHGIIDSRGGLLTTDDLVANDEADDEVTEDPNQADSGPPRCQFEQHRHNEDYG